MIKKHFRGLVIIMKYFVPINIRRHQAPEITMFCSDIIMSKTFKSIKSKRPWLFISISHLFQKDLLQQLLDCSFFYCFGLDFTSFFKKLYQPHKNKNGVSLNRTLLVASSQLHVVTVQSYCIIFLIHVNYSYPNDCSPFH